MIDLFKYSLERGTGKALLILQAHPELDCKELLVHASLHNLAYDAQLEGSREVYLNELIQLSKYKTLIEESLIQHLVTTKDDSWGIYQLFRLVGLFARAGNEKARQAIYQRYADNVNPEYPFIDTLEPIRVDGYEGLRFIAEVRGKMLLEDEDDVEDEYNLESAQELLPHIDVRQQLAQDAVHNRNIRVYLDRIEASKEQEVNPKPIDYSYSMIKRLIDGGEPIPLYVGKRVSHEELILLAHDLMEETDETKIWKYLKIFTFTPFPLDFHLLIPFLSKNNADITLPAIRALVPFKSQKIRQVALEKLNSASVNFAYLNLLIENYEETDVHLIMQLLSKATDNEQIHQLGATIIDIYEKNKTMACLAPLQEVYHKTTCGICRRHAIELLLQNDILPEYIRTEARYDSDLTIRELVQNDN